jgi:hypothetical protein
MKHSAGATDPADPGAYVCAVAQALGAKAVRRWDEVAFDSLVVLSRQFRSYHGRGILVAWNHHFGWSVGIEGHRLDRVLILGGLGIGRSPPPEILTDRTDEVIADLLHLECRAPQRFPAPAVVHWIGSDVPDRRPPTA